MKFVFSENRVIVNDQQYSLDGLEYDSNWHALEVLEGPYVVETKQGDNEVLGDVSSLVNFVNNLVNPETE